MIRQTFARHVQDAVAEILPHHPSETEPDAAPELTIERPRHAKFGDWAVNVSPLAKVLRQPPPQIAGDLVTALEKNEAFRTQFEASVVGAFVNVKAKPGLFAQALAALLTDKNPARSEVLVGERYFLEFVSANPTGPLHIGHGRWAVLGDAIARLWDAAGASAVHREFYINDAGVQVGNLALSLWWRGQEAIKPDRITALEGDPADVLPYPGEFVSELVGELFDADTSLKPLLEADWDAGQAPTPQSLEAIKTIAVPYVRQGQEALLAELGVTFDRWYSEKTLYQSGKIEATIALLKDRGQTYEEDGALWFRSSHYEDEKDRVLRKQDGSYTYLSPDIAYHRDKFARRAEDGMPYNHIVNLWGADHHGYIPRMKAAMAALGEDPNRLEIILGQLVNLIVSGERTRMGKRRRMLTLAEVMQEVGIDATRFWMVSRSADTTLDFDVDLAKSPTNENPVYYVQYAHARASGILRNACQANVRHGDGDADVAEPLYSHEALDKALASPDTAVLAGFFDSQAELESLRDLLLRLDDLSYTVAQAAKAAEPHHVARYALDIAASFHQFYTECRVLTGDATESLPRLLVVAAFRRVLAETLSLLGVSAPESM